MINFVNKHTKRVFKYPKKFVYAPNIYVYYVNGKRGY